MGGLACLASLLRVITEHQADWNNPIMAELDCSMWTILEPALAVIASCLVTFRPLLPSAAVFRRWSHRFSRGSTSTSSIASARGKLWSEAESHDRSPQKNYAIITTIVSNPHGMGKRTCHSEKYDEESCPTFEAPIEPEPSHPGLVESH
jgi:hypothetical protein